MENDSIQGADLITRLGYLCLGSRLKRLGERMQGSVAQALVAGGHSVQPAQLPLLWALRERGAMTVGGLSDAVGVSQPGVSRAVAVLEEQGLVALSAPGRDKRQRCIDLTSQANAMLDGLSEAFFPAVEAAVAALCAVAGDDFLGEIGRIEAGLSQEPLEGRIARQLREDAA